MESPRRVNKMLWRIWKDPFFTNSLYRESSKLLSFEVSFWQEIYIGMGWLSTYGCQMCYNNSAAQGFAWSISKISFPSVIPLAHYHVPSSAILEEYANKVFLPLSFIPWRYSPIVWTRGALITPILYLTLHFLDLRKVCKWQKDTYAKTFAFFRGCSIPCTEQLNL